MKLWSVPVIAIAGNLIACSGSQEENRVVEINQKQLTEAAPRAIGLFEYDYEFLSMSYVSQTTGEGGSVYRTASSACPGALIAPDLVLTTADCVGTSRVLKSFQVRSSRSSNLGRETMFDAYPVAAVARHPNATELEYVDGLNGEMVWEWPLDTDHFLHRCSAFNVALVRLERPVEGVEPLHVGATNLASGDHVAFSRFGRMSIPGCLRCDDRGYFAEFNYYYRTPQAHPLPVMSKSYSDAFIPVYTADEAIALTQAEGFHYLPVLGPLVSNGVLYGVDICVMTAGENENAETYVGSTSVPALNEWVQQAIAQIRQ